MYMLIVSEVDKINHWVENYRGEDMGRSYIEKIRHAIEAINGAFLFEYDDPKDWKSLIGILKHLKNKLPKSYEKDFFFSEDLLSFNCQYFGDLAHFQSFAINLVKL